MNSFFKIIPIIILTCSCSNSSVQADISESSSDAKLILINVIGKDSISSSDLIDSISSEVQYRWATDMSIDLNIVEVKESPAIKESWFTTLGSYVANQERRLSWCKSYVDKHFTKIRANTIFSCVLPPIVDSDGMKYVGGISYVGGFGSEYSISVVQCGNTNPYACALVINHEVGHTFNCSHLDAEEFGPNLMDKAALRFAEPYAWRLPFHIRSKKIALQYLYNNKVKWRKGLLARCVWREANGLSATRCWKRYKDKKFVPLLSN